MGKINFKRDWLPHIVVLALFAILTSIYFYPAFEGKVLSQHDVQQWRSSVQEAKQYNKTHEDVTRWTNSKFSGMPTYQMMGKFDESSWLVKPISMFIPKLFPENIGLIFMAMVGFYILLISLGFSVPISALGAIAFGFCTHNIVILKAGHITKMRTMAFGPLVLSSIMLTFRKRKLWLGASFTAFFLAIVISSNHPQITYYLGIASGIYLLIELIIAFREKDLAFFSKGLGLLLIAVILAFGSHLQRLGTIYEYSQASTRGYESPLEKEEEKSGLDKSYVFSWSYGIAETANLMIPNFMGGSSGKAFANQKDSETIKALRNIRDKNKINRVARQTKQYWGDQPMTSGPFYMGAIICFLFVLGLFLVRGPLKWWLVIITVLAIMLAWGKNFMAFNSLFYHYFPLYSKFRTVTMILYLVQVTLPLMGAMALKQAFYNGIDKATLQSALKKSFLITGGFCLVFALIPGVFLDFTAGGDSTRFLSKNAPQVLEALKSDRASLLKADAFRSLIFIALSAGVIYLFSRGTIKEKVALLAIGVLLIVDLWGVDKRYIHEETFKEKGQKAEAQKSYADQQILKDDDPHYRVFNLTVSPFNNATTSYYHKAIGGYHGAKMGRYNDLIQQQLKDQMRFIQRNLRGGGFIRRTQTGPVKSVISPQKAKELTVLNMLNMKYVILPGRNQGELPVRNPANYGNAWFVRDLIPFEDGAKVMNSLDTLNPKERAVYHQEFSDYLEGFNLQYDPNGSIELTKYEPNELVYRSNAKTPQFSVFSEVYYNDKKGWKVYVDGERKKHMRVNYVLRGMKVPAGEHKIRFVFDPQTPKTLGEVSFASNIIIILIVLGALGYYFYQYTQREEPKPTRESGKSTKKKKK